MTERIADVLAGTEDVAESPEMQRLRRLAAAVEAELDELRAYVAAIDPAVQSLRAIRPLAEVEQDHIEHAVRVTGSAEAAARYLCVSPAKVYRRLGRYAAARREKQRLRRLGARAAVPQIVEVAR